jgi:hypothetical protein
VSNKKTTSFSIDGRDYLVEKFPEDIRKNIEFIDKVTADLDEEAYRYNVLLIAHTALKTQIVELIKKHLKEVEENSNENEENKE